MTSSYSHLFLITLLVAFPMKSCGYYLGTTELRDLEGTDSATFDNELLQWTAYSLQTTGVISYTCDGNILLGGYKTLLPDGYFTRNYAGLPTHTMFTFTVNFWLIDTWNPPDYFILDFDGVSFKGFLGNSYHDFPQPQQFICGGASFTDLGEVKVKGKVLHTGTTLTITLKSKMDEDPKVESFGIRDLMLKFGTANSTDANSFCGSAVIDYTLKQNDCSCSPSQFTSYNPGVCQACDPACATCYWQSDLECFTCSDGYYFVGSRCVPCHSFCSKCFGPNQNQCSQCKPSNFLVLGQTCIDSCNPPMVLTGNTCTLNCPSPKYIYPDLSCQPTCSTPMMPVLANGVRLCEYYCDASKYFYPVSSSCVSICPLRYYADSVDRYCRLCQDSNCLKCPMLSGTQCDLCETGYVLDKDSHCKRCEAMEVDYITSISTGDRFKVKLLPSTCQLDPDFFIANLVAAHESKKKFPPFSFKISQIDSTSYSVDINFEQSVLQEDDMNLQLVYLTGTAMISKKYFASSMLQSIAEYAPQATTVLETTIGASVVGSIMLGTTATLWSLVNFQQFIGYFIFINIEYPVQVELFLSLLQSTSLDFMPNPIASVTDYLSQTYSIFEAEDLDGEAYQPPRKFVKYGWSSNFIDNGGTTFAAALGSLLLIIFIPLLLRIRILPGRWILEKTIISLKWNGAARILLESGIPLILAAFLQCRKISFASFYESLSVALAFFAFFYVAGMAHFFLYILSSTSNRNLRMKKTKTRYESLYVGMVLKNAAHASKYYSLLILFRGILLMFLSTFFEEMPIFQVAPLLIYNIGLVCYLLKKAKFEDKILNFINRLKEILISVGLMGIMCLGFYSKDEDYYQVVGWIVVGVLGITLVIELLYTVVVQLIELKNVPKKFSEMMNTLKGIISKEKGSKIKRKKKVLSPVRRREK